MGGDCWAYLQWTACSSPSFSSLVECRVHSLVQTRTFLVPKITIIINNKNLKNSMPPSTPTGPHPPLLAPICAYWPPSAPTGPHPPLLAPIRPYWPPSAPTGPHPPLLAPIRPYWPPSAPTGPHPPLLAPIRPYWPPSAPTGPHLPLLAPIRPYWPPSAPTGPHLSPLPHYTSFRFNSAASKELSVSTPSQSCLPVIPGQGCLKPLLHWREGEEQAQWQCKRDNVTPSKCSPTYLLSRLLCCGFTQ